MASAAEIAKQMEALIGANDPEATVRHWLDTGYPPLNYALSHRWGGGLPVGRIIEIFGPASSGKTAIATMAMIAAQRAGGIAAFADHEHSFSTDLGIRLGLDTKPGRWIYKKPRTFELSLSMCVQAAKLIRDKKFIPADAPICWVFDSLATMVPDSKLIDAKGKEREIGTFSMHDNLARAKATSGSFDVFNLYVEELGICAIFLNQMRLKPGVVYGDPTTTPGGEAPKFYASVRIQLGATRIAKGKDSDKQVIGSEITARIVKNKVSRPFLSAKWRFTFQPDGSGKFDAVRSLIDFLVEQKRLTKATSGYIEWDGGKFYADALAAKIEKEGAYQKLIDLLPEEYEPPVVAVVEADEPGVTEKVVEE